MTVRGRRAWWVVAALGLAVNPGAGRGQAPDGPYPKFKDGASAPPADAVTAAPFDVAALFRAPPPELDAAPLYLDALFEFSNDVVNCFPAGADRDRRNLAADARQGRFLAILEGVQAEVADEVVDVSVDEFKEGFRKLAEAQRRPRCLFQTGVGVAAQLPHVNAARFVGSVAELKVRRALDRGEFGAAIGDVAAVLRLGRDLRPRGYGITMCVDASMRARVVDEMALPILTAPGLRPGHRDRLAAVLAEDQAAGAEPFTEAVKTEYVSSRATVLALVRDQKTLGRAFNVEPGGSVVLGVFPGVNAAARLGKPAAPLPEDIDIDARVARFTPAELGRIAEMTNRYTRALLALGGRPRVEQLDGLPPIDDLIPGDDLPARVARWVQPTTTWAVVVKAEGRSEALLRASACLAAVRRWQLTHGGASPRPGQLADACREAGLAAVPADPLDGKPMRLAVLDGVPLAYSVGKDGFDGGGRVDSQRDTQPGDLTLRLPPAADPAPPR